MRTPFLILMQNAKKRKRKLHFFMHFLNFYVIFFLILFLITILFLCAYSKTVQALKTQLFFYCVAPNKSQVQSKFLHLRVVCFSSQTPADMVVKALP